MKLWPAAAFLAAIAGCPGGSGPVDGGPIIIVTLSDAGGDGGSDGGDAGPPRADGGGRVDGGCALAFVPSGAEFVAACGSYNYGSGVAAATLGPSAAPDIAFWNVDEITSSPALNLLLNQGDGGLAGGLSSYAPLPSDPDSGALVSVTAGDFTGDGLVDLALSGQLGACAGCTPTGQLVVLPGDGQGNLGSPALLPWPHPSYTVGFMGPQSLLGRDLDGDGIADLAVVMLDDTAGALAEHLVLYLSDGGPLAAVSGDYPLTQGAWQLSSIVAADFEGNGRLDLVVAAHGLYLLRNQGGGRFLGPVTYATQIGVASWVAAADFDGDGRLDLVAGSYLAAGKLGPAVQLFRNDGEGGFVAGPAISVPADPGSYGNQLAAADFDGDGLGDVAAITQIDGGPLLVVFRGEADGGLQAPELFPCGLDDVSAPGAALIQVPLKSGMTALVVGAPRGGDNCTKVTALFSACE